MKHSLRGQAAFEYLITYGWAFLVIITAIGVLSYFGLLNPERYVPDSCEFGDQLTCIDYLIINEEEAGASGHIILRMRNNFQQDIEITGATDVENVLSLRGGNVVIDKGEIKRVEIAIADTETILPKDKLRYKPIIQFRRLGGTVPHNISGTVFAEVIDESVVEGQLS